MTKESPENHQSPQPLGLGCGEGLGPLPEPRMWYDHATQKCHGMAPTGGTNELLWDASDMQAYAAAAVAAERERWARRPLTRDQIAVVATYAPEGVTDNEVAEIVFKVELMHGIRA